MDKVLEQIFVLQIFFDCACFVFSDAKLEESAGGSLEEKEE